MRQGAISNFSASSIKWALIGRYGRYTRRLFSSARRLFLAGAIVSSSSWTDAAITKIWQQRYDGPPSGDTRDEGGLVLRVGNDLVTVGTTTDSNGSGSDVLVIKYSGADGSPIWTQRYDGPDHLDDSPGGAAVDAEGNVYVAAGVGSRASGIDIHTIKYAANDGGVVWQRSYNAAGNLRDEPTCLVLDDAGSVFVSGLSRTPEGYDYYVAKYANADGAVMWQKRATGFVRGMAVDGAGDVFLAGASAGFHTAKINGQDGAVIWERLVGGPVLGHTEGFHIALDRNGDVVVTGARYGDSSYDIFTAKYAKEAGTVIWESTFSSGEGVEDNAYSMALDADQNVIVGGSSGTNLLVLKYTGTNGVLAWEGRVPGQSSLANMIYAVVVNGAGDVFATGMFDSDDYVGRFSGTDGTVVWEKKNSFEGAGQGMVLIGEDVVVTGYSRNTTPPDREHDCYTAMYGADGILKWEKQYNRIRSSGDMGRLVVIDTNKNVVVTGGSSKGQYAARYAREDGRILWQIIDDRTVRDLKSKGQFLAMTGSTGKETNGVWIAEMNTALRKVEDGSIVWEKVFNAGAGVSANGSVLAVDVEDNVIAAGAVGLGWTDICMAKHRGADGFLLWEKRFATPEPGYDFPYAMALDREQNVFIAGISDRKFFVGKYAGSDGSVLWEQRVAVSSNVLSMALSISIDSNGDAVATGGTWSEVYTGKFRGLNGQLLWEKRFSVSPIDRANESRVTLDSQDNVILGATYSDIRNREGGNVIFIKYAIADGAVLWERRIGVAEMRETPVSVSIVEADDVIAAVAVRENVNTSNPLLRFSLLKLAGEDGRVISEFVEENFEAVGVTTTRDGTAVITGRLSADLYTIQLQDELRARLNLSVPAKGTLNIRWPDGNKGWRLEVAPNLNGFSGKASWTILNSSTGTNAISITNEDTTKSGFFRLVKP